jgi:pyrroloquinoline quinone (PQQ) biosynthesis protein C
VTTAASTHGHETASDKKPRNRLELEITPNTGWAKDFWDELTPYKDQVVNHPYFRDASDLSLSLERLQRALIDFYPLVENFPKYMGLILSKTTSGLFAGDEQTRYWLMTNMMVERKHADWWVDFAIGFGCDRDALYHAKPGIKTDALNHYLWNVNTRCSLAEGIGATNLAIEWATGEWTRNVMPKAVEVGRKFGFEPDKKTLAWMDAHAEYDDHHPYEAMEIIKFYCAEDKELRAKTLEATKKGIQYYLLGLDECYHGK